MKVPVDFSHLITLRDLDTEEEQYFLLPRGERTPVHIPGATLATLRSLLRPSLVTEDLEPETVAEVELRPSEPEAQTVSILEPGHLGDASGFVPEG